MLSRLSLFAGFVLSLLPAATAAAAERPTVVELFTSEGCSSCPPADAYLTELSRGRPDVLPLAFHVTYWDSFGWKDPFSLDAATERQLRYAARFSDRPFTPEAVVDGAIGTVGSRRGEVESAIQKSKSDGRTAASISVRRQNGQLSIEIGPGSGTGRILLIGFDHEHRTDVQRGENGGRTLIESNVVRSIRTAAQWSGKPLQISEPFPDGAQDVAILLEAPDGGIIGASRLGVSKL
jgi:hypothetical protein